MREFLKKLGEPFASIKANPLQFAVWWIVANVVGLAGFWLPLGVQWYRGGAASLTIVDLVASGSLATFSIVILADGIATSLATVGGLNPTAAGIRGLAGALALLVVVIQGVILSAGMSLTSEDHPHIWVSIGLTLSAIILASYLYCFRSSEWEKSVEQIKEQEDKEVGDLGASAAEKTDDGAGAQL